MVNYLIRNDKKARAVAWTISTFLSMLTIAIEFMTTGTVSGRETIIGIMCALFLIFSLWQLRTPERPIR